MFEKILNSKGAHQLNSHEQKTITGGLACKLEADGSYSCPRGTVCEWNSMLCRLPSDIYG